ncbi:permease [Heyndrickxia shackletonii]|uniref:Permease n=1 Tax=Heyndrickxia shackletonii TaxID=157838 RepID=A0A0Q3WWX3_9BACI|nr:cytosine permease [Heyndrickxia shackletonii]KQL52871.1 permease [Heyndrickxia shackletonii]MBB2480722.1 cytosine permease [Bacillus sp. APMAM]NEZ00359.1 permease [Heyndrickxia shackletonii]RTZ55970.1 permease [Bacillus sp. SAJ1]
MEDAKGMKSVGKDEALLAVPLAQRQHWMTPAMIFGGLEFTIPVLMIGATLSGSYGMGNIFWILAIGLIFFQWIGNSIQGYIGAKTGRSSSVIARSSFGAAQARFIVGLTIFIVSLGWWALQTAVAGNAISAMFGVDYEKQWGLWAVITVIAGLIFAIPSIIGYSSMKWTDYIAVPAGLALIVGCIFYALRNTGFDKITSWHPEPKITFLAAISLVIGANVSQWVIASDYTRYAKPKWKDNILIPLGIVAVGFPLFYVGSIMSVGVGDADIVNVMLKLGFPLWGFLVLWFATWTSQLVNNYSMGLALANMFNINSGKGRALLTLLGTIIAIFIALAGILDYFTDFLYLTALIYPAIGGVMMADFFLIRKQQFVDHKGWNWMATIALVAGTVVGYLTQYVYEFGLPAVQSIIISAFIYWVAMKIKAKVKPDHFTEVHLDQNRMESEKIV